MGLIVSAFDDTYDLDFLREALLALDPRLDELDEFKRDAAPETDDAHEASLRADHVCGLGFVACQNYLIATASLFKLSRNQALECDPIHARSGVQIAALANSLANFWKHHTEWDSPPPISKRSVQHLRALGIEPTAPFPLSAALDRLVDPLPPRFNSLVPFLQRWRDAVRKRSGH